MAALLSGVGGVVVANAAADFVAELRRRICAREQAARIHFASQPYAAGVLEGMHHFGIRE